MAQTSHLKSTAITNLDALPYVPVTGGQGAKAYEYTVEGYVIPLAADATGSTYQLVRVDSDSILKSVDFRSEAQGAGKFDLSVYYSDSTIDGTAVANQGLVVPTTGASFISGDIDCSSAVGPTNELGSNSAGWNMSMWNQPLWLALGLTSDPGGKFDIVAVCHTTAVTTGTGRLGVSVRYTN